MGIQERINDAITKYQTEREYSSYLTNLNEEVKAFLTEGGNDFIYFSISYFYNNKLESLPVIFNENYQDEDIKTNIENTLNNAFKIIDQGICLSLSESISKNNLFSLIISNADRPSLNNNSNSTRSDENYLENYINLMDYNFTNNLENHYADYCKILNTEPFDRKCLSLNLDFFNSEKSKNYSEIAKILGIENLNKDKAAKSKYDAIIALYKHISETISKSKDQIFFQFLRPLSAFEEYNGQIYIATKKLLNENESLTLSLLLFRYLTEEVYYKNKQNAIKSAKAAIMSRNMSHNLGSHVMYYLKLKLGNVYNILTDNVLKDVITRNNSNGYIHCYFQRDNCKLFDDLSRIINVRDQEETSISFPFLIGLGRFINYLQERMDFIATVSTDYIPYFMTVNFKDSVYDELNYDLKMERHQETDSFKGKKVDNILLDNIARSEGLNRENIILKYGNFEGTKDSIISNEISSLEELRKINIDLPGGQTGRQAIFSIFENFIRNSAKHSGLAIKNNGNKLIISMKVENIAEYPDLIKFSIWNNLKDAGNNDENIKKLNSAIDEEYVDNLGVMIGTNKGIKEMKISAAWLRGVTDEEMITPPILNAISVDDNGVISEDDNGVISENHNIGYKFYLLKPQEVAIICQRKDITKINKEIVKYGWQLFTIDSFIKNAPRHKMVVIDSVFNNDDLNKIYEVSHSRVIIADLDDSFYSTIQENNGKDRKKLLIPFYQKHVKDILKISGTELKEVLIDDNIVVPADTKKFEKIKIDPGNGPYNDQICFIKHFLSDSSNSKRDNGISSQNDIPYIESITGHNSTDRLIRNGNYDKYWYLQMNESALTKVAIFDERLWSDFSQIPNDVIENFLNNESANTNGLAQDQNNNEIILNKINEIKNSENPDNYEELFNFISDSYNLQYNQTLLDACVDIFKGFKDYETCFTIINNIVINNSPLIEDPNIEPISVNSAILKNKNLSIYNVIQYNEGFAIIKHNFSKNSASKDIEKKEYKIVGQITQVDGEIKIIHRDTDQYHFVTIHQGILDKIFEKFNIKNDETKMIEVTNLIKEKYCYPNKEKHINSLIIHSGRSKPVKKDMPQKIPFIQYSSLENAIKDCKFSLTEVLYAARYE